MMKSMTALYAFLAFVLGALVALGGQHLFFQQKDTRDSMATLGTFQGWRLNCQPRTLKDGVCVMQQALGRKGSDQIVAEVNITPKDKADPKSDVMTIVAPLGVFVIPGLKVSAGTVQKAAAFKTCLPAGCVATLPIDPSLGQALTQNANMQITVTTADGKAVPLTFSLQGYGDALAARAIDMAARK